MTDQEYMQRAIELAEKGEGWCHPNPKVGAVIVKNGRIIGEGYHARYGDLHAERSAFASLSESAEGADMYVTLEPCCHHGHQPPCTDAILGHGIRRIFIGSRDPNPLVAGKGAQILIDHGIEVISDFMRDECDALNPVFFHYITKKMPYVVMKYAMTMDGKIATYTGASKWITGEAARQKVQKMRHALMAIMVGIGTVLADDPLLTCRLENGRSPVRVVCDGSIRLPTKSRLVQTAKEIPVWDVCSLLSLPTGELDRADFEDKEEPLRARACDLLNTGVRIFNFPTREDVDLVALFQEMGREEIDSVLVEGGGTLNESVLKSGLVNEVDIFMAPKIFGGAARTPVAGLGVEDPSEAWMFKIIDTEKIGEDLLIRLRPK